MKMVNVLIAALFVRNKEVMKYSSNTTVLLIAKLVFCLLLWIFLLPVLVLAIELITQGGMGLALPMSRLFAAALLFLLYLVVNPFIWKTAQVEEFVADEENQNTLRKANQYFIGLLIVGFIFLVVVARAINGPNV